MGYTKDLWTRPEKQQDGEIKRVPNARWGKGKRWLACWLDPDEREVTKAFASKTPASKYWRDQESARDRGEYVDPKAGRGLMSELQQRYLKSISVDPSTYAKYEQIARLRIEPVYGKRAVKTMNKPSQVQTFLTGVKDEFGWSTAHLTRHVLGAMLDIALVDGDLKTNPVRSRIVSLGKKSHEKVVIWSDATLWAVIDAHPPELKTLPVIGATCGHREGELFAIAEEDFDFKRQVIHIRRQIKRVGKVWCFAFPKSDAERVVPLADYTAEHALNHMKAYPPKPVTLPWEKPDGELRTFRLLFVHPDSGEHLRASTYRRWWQPAIAAAGLTGPKAKKAESGSARYPSSRRNGRHALRHFYAAAQLTGGTNIRELADYLGHLDPAFTLRVYEHLQPDSHERARKAIETKFRRLRAVS